MAGSYDWPHEDFDDLPAGDLETGPGEAAPGIDTSVDAARMSACATIRVRGSA
jgi:hypothetical protein